MSITVSIGVLNCSCWLTMLIVMNRVVQCCYGIWCFRWSLGISQGLLVVLLLSHWKQLYSYVIIIKVRTMLLVVFMIQGLLNGFLAWSYILSAFIYIFISRTISWTRLTGSGYKGTRAVNSCEQQRQSSVKSPPIMQLWGRSDKISLQFNRLLFLYILKSNDELY